MAITHTLVGRHKCTHTHTHTHAEADKHSASMDVGENKKAHTLWTCLERQSMNLPSQVNYDSSGAGLLYVKIF